MTFYSDMSYKEIAEVTSVPEGTVKTRVFHAKKPAPEVFAATYAGEGPGMNMTAQERRATEELLPFWANGSLDDDERLEVERALKADAALSEQVAMLRLVRGGMQDSDDIQSPRRIRSWPGCTAPSTARRFATFRSAPDGCAVCALAAAVVGASGGVRSRPGRAGRRLSPGVRLSATSRC
jgi:hypothetical protein